MKKHIHPSYLEVYNLLKRKNTNKHSNKCRMYKEQGSREESNRETSFPLESGISDARKSWAKPGAFAGRVSLSHATTFIH